MLLWLGSLVRPPRLRPIRQFVEEEVVIPSGPEQGRKFRIDRNPFAGLWFNAIDSGDWRRFAATGPQQSGKTLCCFAIPVMYHLFEVGETVLMGVPSLDMVADKWGEDLLPAISMSRYRDLLPDQGAGSRGGAITRIQFKNGATLRFMTGGGGDKSRAGFTTRVLGVTEVDGMDEAGGSSRETDKISQLEGRTAAFGDRARVYLECTVSFEEGRIWQEYSRGTGSRIAVRCPHCGAYVTPEREHLVGWQDAPDLVTAGEQARICCPGCGGLWDEAERVAANGDPRLVHRGQEIHPDGSVKGEAPRTNTLGFRWTAANNLLVPMRVVAQKEWEAARDPDEENGDRKMRQFFWALPVKPDAQDLTLLDHDMVARRVTEDARGRVPSEAEQFVVGVDCGLRLLHWVALAAMPGGGAHVVDYGVEEVKADELGQDKALLIALRDFRDKHCLKGWDSDTGRRRPDLQLVDSGWCTERVYEFCRGSPLWFPAKGFGETQYGRPQYSAPRETSKSIAFVGEEYHVVRLRKKGVRLIDINADHWKGQVHARLGTPLDRLGALTLFKADAKEHTSIGKHFTAEKQVREHVAGRGVVVRWVLQGKRANHLLDAGAIASVAAHLAKHCRVIGAPVAPPAAPAAAAPEPPRDDTPPAAAAAAMSPPPAPSWFRARKRK